MSFKSFEEVIAFMEKDTLNATRPLGRNIRECRLERMRILMDKLGNPQKDYKTLHVAGSKGKGSTASFLAAGIHALGYKTGLYLSPHVSDYRERFTINGGFAPDDDLINTGNILEEKLKDFSFEESLGEESPTSFEMYTAFAFLLFKQVGCTWAVIETGLGGRLDATNILKPEASIITPIELEHTELLGDTIAKIAGEKAKIIKPHTPCFIGFQKDEAMEVFFKEAKANNSIITTLQGETFLLKTNAENFKQIVDFSLHDGFHAHLYLDMLGECQADNAALALLVLRRLGLYEEGTTEHALESNTLPGRMERINWKRTLFVDGAHTENSINLLVQSIKKMYTDCDPICIFGCLSDKKINEMGKILVDNFKTIIVSKPGSFKKNNPEEIYQTLLKIKSDDTNVLLIEDTKQALDYCVENSKSNTPILVCGSFYLAGEIKKVICL